MHLGRFRSGSVLGSAARNPARSATWSLMNVGSRVLSSGGSLLYQYVPASERRYKMYNGLGRPQNSRRACWDRAKKARGAAEFGTAGRVPPG